MDTNTIPATSWPLINFLEFEKSINGGSKLPLHAKRRGAFESFSKNGFPTTKIEEWKYTNVTPIRDAHFVLVQRPTAEEISKLNLSRASIDHLDSYRIVLVDGFFAESLSDFACLPKGITITSLAEAQKQSSKLLEQHLAQYASTDESFVALNTAFIRDGVVVHVDRGSKGDKPLHIQIVNSGKANSVSTPRVLIVAEAHSEITFIESYVSLTDSSCLTNSVVECVLGENAHVDHYRIQQESQNAYHVSTIQAQLDRAGVFRTHTFSLGGKLARNHVNVILNGSGCNTTMNGLSVLSGEQHVDNQTLLDNVKPNCESLELYKGIYGDKSQGVFSGTIIVRPDAQKTNAVQSNRSLLLTNEASVNTKPQLKIWADDVKCTHGATIGQLDDDALFYIRSRGVSESDARVMLIHAFASEIISQVRNESLKSHLEAILIEKLQIAE